MKSDKIILNDTILTLINDYTDIILRQRMQEIYEICKSPNILYRALGTNCDEFIKFINQGSEPNSNLAIALKCLNAIFNSQDIEDLATSSLYKDVLNGRICSKPKDDQEAINVVEAIRQVLGGNYLNIINQLVETENQPAITKIIGDNPGILE